MDYNTRNAISQLGSEFIYKVYAWMSGGLAITAFTSYVVANSVIMDLLYSNSFILYLLFLIQIGLIMALSFYITKLSYNGAALVYILYSMLTGITLSGIFAIYTTGSIVSTFFVSSGMFGGLALWGYYTKSDLSKLGSIAMGALFGLILASIVNIFIRSSAISFIASVAGVLIFSALIAYDMQKIKDLSRQFLAEGQEANKVAIICGLTLYLDFINLFLYLLRFFGEKKDNNKN